MNYNSSDIRVAS